MGDGTTHDYASYTRDDFLTTTAPFEAIYKLHNDQFQEGRALEAMSEVARSVKITNFKALYQAYVKSIKSAIDTPNQTNVTRFEAQDRELDIGDWTADETGVWRYGINGPDYACAHPIMPVERLRNIDTGELKVKLAYRRGANRRGWNEILTDFDTVANAKNIVSLARIGISVTSGRRAQNLVDYLTEVMDRNYDRIPERKSVSRMGWNEEGFSPYVDGVIFDGNDRFERVFKSIHPAGDYMTWACEAMGARDTSLTARIVLAASFASALIGKLGIQPFFVHLWGMDSGTGKTVALMLAASVWADPSPGGEYVKTFKSTSVGFEIMAGFLNSLPLCIDELQLAKDNRGKMIFNVYELASGSGKLRSNKTLGLASTPTWANCFITTGETPLTGDQDGAGALNRVIEIECRADAKVIEDGHRTSEVVKTNYGHAGREFVRILQADGMMEVIRGRYHELYDGLLKSTTEKQAWAAALLVVTDELLSAHIFPGTRPLKANEIAEFLKSRESVSAAARGYAYLCDWVAQNGSKLCGKSDIGEVYGDIGKDRDAGWVWIVRSVFNRVCADAGISAQALLSHLKSRGLIQTRGKNMTRGRRINGILTECVMMKLSQQQEEMVEVDEPNPFTD